MINSKQSIISILVPDDRLGGAEGVLKKIATHYLQHERIVHVFFLKKSVGAGWFNLKDDFDNCFLHFTQAVDEKHGIISLSKKLINISKKNKIDITYSSHVHLIALVSVLCFLRVYKTNYLVTRELTMMFEVFKSYKRLFFKFLYYISIKSVDLKIFQTQEMFESFTKHLSIAPRYNSIVLHNPVDLNALQMKSQEFSTNIVEPYIVACGRLHTIKGFDLLIEAFDQIGNTNFNLVIVGDGPERENLHMLRENARLREHIFLLGHKSNPIPYLREAFGCILSSRLEGFPNALLEMMSQNGRVVATNCAGGVDKIPNLYLAKKNDLESLILAVSKMLKSTNEERDSNFRSFSEYLKDKSVLRYVTDIEKALDYRALA